MSHFLGDSLSELLEWDLKDLCFWYVEAVEVHNKLNPENDSE